MSHGRNATRIAVTGQASVISLLTDDSADGTLLDLSRKGVRLYTNHTFQRGQKLALTLKLPWDEPPIEVLLAAVKWARENNVGVEFLDLEEDAQVSLDVFLSSRSKL
ncbi:MAG: PilZ domain-containing protein [Nitrospiraceae bacterium]